MKVVCISDTHLTHEKYRIDVPMGDLLICAGDFTFQGYPYEINQFSRWLYNMPHRYKVVIAGNHDRGFEDEPARAEAHLQGCDFIDPWEPGNGRVCTYLNESEVNIEGLRIWGSPWTPRFFDWAFNADRGSDIKQHWNKIPDGIDILVTHGPPFGHGDIVKRDGHQGCADLAAAIKRIKPKYHIYGHIHPGYGVTQDEHTTYINAAICDDRYVPVHAPIVFDI